MRVKSNKTVTNAPTETKKKPKKGLFMARQGDVLIMQIKEATTPKNFLLRPTKGKIVLAYGEETGHEHQLPDENATISDNPNPPEGTTEAILEVSAPTSVTHEEHSAVALEPGRYKVITQREHNPRTERSSRVRD